MNETSDTPPQSPRRFERSGTDRVIGGVCGGLASYFDIDVTLARIGMVALALLGGSGLIVYAAALVLVPADGAPAQGRTDARDRALAIGLAIVLTIAAFGLGGFGLGIGFALLPVAALSVLGLAVWWLVSGERPAGSPRGILARAALGVGVLAGCAALALGSFLAAGLGGGVVIAALVIAAGVALVAAAFAGRARWLALPALAIAIPLAFVAAADIDLDGGFGEKRVRPATLGEVRDGYRLGAGELTVDLRGVKLPAGERRLSVGIGAGHAVVLVDRGVCVASRASVGMGGVGVFERDGGGVDVDWRDEREAPRGTPRLVIDGDVGLGLLEVRHHERKGDFDGPGRRWNTDDPAERNDACTSGAGRGSGGATSG